MKLQKIFQYLSLPLLFWLAHFEISCVFHITFFLGPTKGSIVDSLGNVTSIFFLLKFSLKCIPLRFPQVCRFRDHCIPLNQISPICLLLLINLFLWDTFYGQGPLYWGWTSFRLYDSKFLGDSVLTCSPLACFLLSFPLTVYILSHFALTQYFSK